MFGSIFVLKFYASVWRRRLLVVFVAACRCRIRETLNMFGAGAAVVVACASYSKYQQALIIIKLIFTFLLYLLSNRVNHIFQNFKMKMTTTII